MIVFKNGMRFAHVSDLHANGSEVSEDRLHHLLTRLAAARIDHLLITGDLTNSGREEELEQVSRNLRTYGFFSRDRLTVIPGNHDLLRCIYQQFSAAEIVPMQFRWSRMRHITRKLFHITRAIRAFGPEEYRQAMEKFHHYFHESYRDTEIVGSDFPGGYPRVKRVGEVDLLLLDSNYLLPSIILHRLPRALRQYRDPVRALYGCGKNLFGSNGWIDLEIVRHAFNTLRSMHRSTIVLMHHYMYTRKDVEAVSTPLFADSMALGENDEECRNPLADLYSQEKVRLILHGHWHLSERYFVGNPCVEVLNGGAGMWQWWEISSKKGVLAIQQRGS